MVNNSAKSAREVLSSLIILSGTVLALFHGSLFCSGLFRVNCGLNQ